MSRPYSLNLVFIGESYLGGMAGSKRIQNLINPLLKTPGVTIGNLILDEDPAIKVNSGIANGVVYQTVRSANRVSTLFRFLFTGTGFLRKLKKRGKLNVLYCYDHPTVLNFPLIIAARSLGYKIVLDVVEDYSLLERHQLTGKQKLMVRTKTVLLSSARLFASTIFCISEPLRLSMERVARGKFPVHLLPPSVDMSMFENTRHGRGDKMAIFYGGSFGEKDGIPFLISGFEKLIRRGIRADLILTGKPPKAGMSSTLDLIRKSEFSAFIHYKGFLGDNEFYRLMNQCSVFCMTRVDSGYARTGFPFKLGEMLATGKPVIATRVGDVPKYVTDKTDAVLVEPGNSDQIAEALKFLHDNPEKAAVIGQRGRETAIRNFDAHTVSQQLLDHLTKLN